MLRRPLACLIVASLFPCSVSAESLKDAARRQAARQTPATQSVRPNPYKMPALGLMAGGAGLLIIGLAKDRGIESNLSGTTATVKETGGSKTALEVLGVLAAAGGGYLYWAGEQKRHRPAVVPVAGVSRGRFTTGVRLAF